LQDFGGCNFSERPIDFHISAAKALGAREEGKTLRAEALFGGEVEFPMPSVGATVNAILLAVSAVGETVIRGSACEPHIDALIDFLVSAGADIRRDGGEIVIKGRRLRGGKTRIPGDMIEAGTFLALGALSREGICVSGADTAELSSVLEALSSLGAEITVRDGAVTARRGEGSNYAELVAEPYPGFPTDLQPIFAVAMHAFGGKITDLVWRDRFGYLDSLSRFGIASERCGNSARIYPSVLKNATAEAPDLRGGMAVLLAAICADGVSEISSAELILRGYDSLIAKLCALSLDVRYE
jgi:UDP-N-acetylglucosamine 1-carboxyvinyltransferase